jgi:hypothetical protein
MKLSPEGFNIGLALLAAVVVFGPVAVLLWFSWRNVLAGAMLFGAFAVFMFTLMAVGASGWSPNGSLGLALLMAAACVVGLVLGAWFLATGTIGFRLATVALSVVAAGWVTLGWGFVEMSLRHADVPIVDYVAVRLAGETPIVDHVSGRFAPVQAGTARLRDSLDRALGPADSVARDPVRDMLLVVNAEGDSLRLTPRPGTDIAFFGSGVIRSHRMFIRFVSDRRLDPYLAGRELVLVTWDSKDKSDLLKPRRNVPVVFTTAERLEGSYDAFYDPATGGFTIGPYRWMKDVLGIPTPQRDALYRQYFGKVPE